MTPGPTGWGGSRALRPLAGLVAARPGQVLDERATAARAADDGQWLPQLRPASGLRWDAVVMVDDHLPMALWRDTVAGLVARLRRQWVLREVRTRRLPTGAPPEPGTAGWPVPTGRGGTGRRVVVVVTDGTAPGWYAGTVLPLLYTWALRLPVVIVALLPQQQWYRTGLQPQRLRLRCPVPGAANARVTWQRRNPVPDPVADRLAGRAVPVPVLELSPPWLAVWARFVTGTAARSRWASLPAVLAVPWAPAEAADALVAPVAGSALRRHDPQPPADPGQRVREFTSRAAPAAQTLAVLLAAVPLTMAVMRTVQRELAPDADTSHLAEILDSGLLSPVAGGAGTGADPARVSFEFVPGVREVLLAAGRRTDTIRVLRTVAARCGAQVPAVRGLGQVVEAPDTAPLPVVSPETEPFVRAEQAALQALSGRYRDRARRLRELLPGPPGKSIDEGRDSARRTTAERDDGVTMEGHPVSAARRPAAPEGASVSSSVPTEQPPPAPAPEPATSTTSELDATGHRPAGRVPPIWGNIPPRNPNFTGRDKLLEQLHEQIQGGTTAVLPHALHGMGGVGKSHLAIEYVYRHQGEYDLVWWIPAERAAQIGAAMVELAQRMNLAAGPDVASAVPAVQEALRLGQPYANWLLVFDNAESPETVRRFFPTGGSGSIMVTSRTPHWASVARALEVNVFTREESIQLVRRRGPEIDDAAANELAEALGDLPLALEQAAAWRAETGMPADEYLRLFHDKRIELLEVAAPMDYQLPVAAAWNVSLDRLVVTNPAAFRLLQLCSFLAPEPIPRTLLGGAHNADIHPELNAALRDPMRLSRAIRDINRYALARVNHRTNSIQMHRLVQLVLADRMSPPERESMRHSAHLLLASGDRNDPDTPANWQSYADLYPHMIVSEAIHSTDPWVQQLVNNEATYLYWSGDFEAAFELSRNAYGSRRERLEPDHEATLKIGWWLGFMLFVLGRFQEAAEHNTQILAAYQRITDEDTEDLLAAVGAVAADRRAAGDFAAALEIDEDLYQRHVRALGEEDPATLNAAHNLAVSLRLTGEVQRALEIDEQTHRLRVLLFGEDHTATLESTFNIIIDRRERGDYLGARNQQQEIFDRLRQVSELGHTQLLRAQRRLASALRKAGDHVAARAASEEVRAGFASRYGVEHPDTVLADFGLAIDYRGTGDLDAAVALGEQVRERYRRVLGDEHPYTVATSLNLAVALRQRGEGAQARQLDEQGLEVLTRRLGADHPLTLACAVNLANDLYILDEVGAAYARDADTADRLHRRLGPHHPSTLICRGNLAMDLAGLGREDEARQVHHEIVPVLQHTLGDHHPATLAGVDMTIRGDCDLDPMPL